MYLFDKLKPISIGIYIKKYKNWRNTKFNNSNINNSNINNDIRNLYKKLLWKSY